MRILSVITSVLLAAALAARAQVSVEIVLEQEQFLRDESLPLKVRVTNRSGQTIKLGQSNDWLTFTVEALDGGSATKLGEVPVAGEFSLASAKMGTRQVDLMPYFDFSHPGRYVIAATVKIREWKEEITTHSKTVEIVRGTRIWEQEFGVPGAGAAPEARKYSLVQASNRKRIQLYARVTDMAEDRVFRVLPVCQMLSFSKPEAQVDRASRLHVLCQSGARSFIYNVITPEGALTVRQSHDYAGTRPGLRLDAGGQVLVRGGARRPTAHDLPAPAEATNAPALLSPVHPANEGKPPQR